MGLSITPFFPNSERLREVKGWYFLPRPHQILLKGQSPIGRQGDSKSPDIGSNPIWLAKYVLDAVQDYIFIVYNLVQILARTSFYSGCLIGLHTELDVKGSNPF